MKILLTGGEGFLGTNLREYLTDEIMVWDETLGRDIFDDMDDAVKNSDVVIHLAAKTSVAESFKNPSQTFRVNVLGTARICELCVKYHKRLIYPSSASVFAPDLSPYAQTKYVAEEVVKGIMALTPVTILRFVNMFGLHMNPRSGSMMYNFLNADKIVVFGDGEQTRDFISVKDVVRIIKDTSKKKWEGRIVDVGTGQPYSTNYIAGLFSHFRGVPISYAVPKREMRWHVTDVSLLKNLYKKPLITNLEKDVEELCRTHSMS